MNEWQAHFGPFILSPSARLLTRDGIPIRLGGRALDLLITLVESAGKVIEKRELIAKVWPGLIVEEGNLRFHILAIRRALGDNANTNQFVRNVANKGYSFIHPVRLSRLEIGEAEVESPPSSSLPSVPVEFLGRDVAVAALVVALERYRLVSVVGPGGIGKTSVAIAVMHALYMRYNGDMHFVDLSSCAEVDLVYSTIGSAIGMSHFVGDPVDALEAHLRDRHSLIVLDCCEHLIGLVAKLTDNLTRGCFSLRFLVTSREPLRGMNEFVYRLSPLAYPPDDAELTREQALAYPAVRLFVERARAGGAEFRFSDEDVALVTRLCRKLDGIALAIELAASRIGALSLLTISDYFDAGASLAWRGPRTANPRHQTLAATLAWSINLLSQDESRLLSRIAIFNGSFSLEAVLNVCGFDDNEFTSIELLASLVAKSLLSVDAGGATLRYRLLDTTRSYCMQMLQECEEFFIVSERHAHFFTNLAREVTGNGTHLDTIRNELSNLRSGFYWYLQHARQTEGITLAVIVCPLLLDCSRLVECSHWAQVAWQHLPIDLSGSIVEMYLQASLGQSLMYLGSGRNGRAETAYRRGIEIASDLEDRGQMLRLLCEYIVLLHREGLYTEALAIGLKAQSLLPMINSPQAAYIVDSLMGVCLHFVGELNLAAEHWENCHVYRAGQSAFADSQIGFEQYTRSRCGLSRILWLQGHCSHAYTMAREIITSAKERGHAITYSIALIWAGSVYSYAQDVDRIGEVADELERIGRLYALEPYRDVARVLGGQVLIIQGNATLGVQQIRKAVDSLHRYRYEMVTSVALTFLAAGLANLSLYSACLSVCDEAETMIRNGGDMLRLPELSITRGECLTKIGRLDEAEQCLNFALELAKQQGALSTQLRAAIPLCSLLAARNCYDLAQSILLPLIHAVPDELAPDLHRARALLDELACHSPVLSHACRNSLSTGAV